MVHSSISMCAFNLYIDESASGKIKIVNQIAPPPYDYGAVLLGMYEAEWGAITMRSLYGICVYVHLIRPYIM